MLRRPRLRTTALATTLALLALGGCGRDEKSAWAPCTENQCSYPDATPLLDSDAWKGSFPFSADLANMEPADLLPSLRRACSECTAMYWTLDAANGTWSDVHNMTTKISVTVSAIGVDKTGQAIYVRRSRQDLVATVDDSGLAAAQALGTGGSPWSVPKLSWLIVL